MCCNSETPRESDGRVRRGGRRFSVRASVVTFLVAVQAILTISPPVLRAAPDTGPPSAHNLMSGNLHALVVGVSTYRDLKIPKLELADRDARAFGEFLESQKKVFKETRVTFLLNDNATKAEVEKYLYYTMHGAGKNDTVILFFSGHGAYDPMRPREFLFLTHDSDPQYLRATAVRMSGLEFLKGIEAERVLIIADACYSGGFSDTKPKATGHAADLFLAEVRSSSGTAVITSGKEGQLAWEVPNLANSVFTHNLIKGLKGKADKDHDGVVTLNEAYQYAYNLTRQETKGHQHPQFEGKIVGPFPLSFVGAPLPPGELKKQLLVAAKIGDVDKTEQLLNAGADVNARDDENNTPLVISADQGHASVVGLLVSRGADLEAKNQQRVTALGAACDKGRTDVVELLLTHGANVHTKTAEGLTPLALACRTGNSDVVKLLLASGADLKSRTILGKTPLLIAASEGHADVVKLLVERGADVNAKDLEAARAWTVAARHGHGRMVEFLVRNGADVNSRRGGFLDNQLILATLHNDVDRAR
ncbi:MAG: ankyrin repeat domain-containing protein, partial [Deltaproteobacteria bacterium]|nr:ankyrin repeat domain-containing protein [Deltaproteobacteria bacterium]